MSTEREVNKSILILVGRTSTHVHSLCLSIILFAFVLHLQTPACFHRLFNCVLSVSLLRYHRLGMITIVLFRVCLRNIVVYPLLFLLRPLSADLCSLFLRTGACSVLLMHM